MLREERPRPKRATTKAEEQGCGDCDAMLGEGHDGEEGGSQASDATQVF